jgi:hypothetical protein
VKRPGLDQPTKDLIEKILKLEPSMRISLKDMMTNKFFIDKGTDSAHYWSQVAQKQLDNVPFLPNVAKYNNLLVNSYPV